MFLPFIKGFSTSGGLIVAIGAQNAFVLKQGLTRNHLFLTALLCSLLDAILISLGVLGFGTVISSYPFFIDLAKYCAFLFLFIYGILSFRSFFKERSLSESHSVRSKRATLFTILALTLLNPHVYLDTIILLGTISSQLPEHETNYFAFGAILASFIWFFTITYGSSFLAPYLNKPIFWKVMDGVIAITMWIIAFSILLAI